MTIKGRIATLEKKRGAKDTDFIILYFDGGIVTKEHNRDKYPELIGKTEAEIDRIYSGRDDVQVIKIVYASQANE